MINKYKLITMKELNILFLEYKYALVKPYTYSAYQFKARVVNEYMGDELVIYIDISKIKEFRKYLNIRRWEYIEKGSERSINQIMSYLYQILRAAKKWKIIDRFENKKNNNYIEEKSNFVEKRNNYLIKNELKRASNKIDTILNNKLIL